MGLRNSGANNWLLRGLYSKDWGFDLKPGLRHWNYTFIYGEADLFAASPRQFVGYAELRKGVSFDLHDNLIITPHLLADGRFYGLVNNAAPYVEAGGGVSLKFILNHGQHRLRRATLELLLQYRVDHMFRSPALDGSFGMTSGRFVGTTIVSF